MEGIDKSDVKVNVIPNELEIYEFYNPGHNILRHFNV